jgi:multidrug efflux pump subunit AcrA (membrane-fusion protein)
MLFKYNTIRLLLWSSLVCLAIVGCKKSIPADTEKSQVKAEVSIGYVKLQSINEYLKLNAVTAFQKKDNIRSTITGYISTLNFKPGDFITTGSIYCYIISKEQRALKSFAGKDTSLNKFQKPLPVYSNASGIISTQQALQGDYTGEGDVLAVITEPASLVVLLNVPFEYHRLVTPGKKCDIILPDGSSIKSSITKEIPTVDVASQAQTYIIMLPDQKLPENLNVIVQMEQKTSKDALCVNRSAVQTNETQDEFWVMKMLNDSQAVKTRVTLGLQTDSLIEISSSNIQANDRIVLNGAYGLSDSSLVKISNLQNEIPTIKK